MVILRCMQGVGVEEMKAGDQPVIGTTSTYQEPGVYTLEASSQLAVIGGFALHIGSACTVQLHSGRGSHIDLGATVCCTGSPLCSAILWMSLAHESTCLSKPYSRSVLHLCQRSGAMMGYTFMHSSGYDEWAEFLVAEGVERAALVC